MINWRRAIKSGLKRSYGAVRETAQIFWASKMVALGTVPEEADVEKRKEVLFILERWLDNIVEFKKEQWLYAYSTMAAMAAISYPMVSRPNWLKAEHGWAGAGLLLVLTILWAAAHTDTNAGLMNARRGKDISYAMLGDIMTRARPANQLNSHVGMPRMLAIAVLTASAFSQSAAIDIILHRQAELDKPLIGQQAGPASATSSCTTPSRPPAAPRSAPGQVSNR